MPQPEAGESSTGSKLFKERNKMRLKKALLTLGTTVVLIMGSSAQATDNPMGFFITSVGLGDGANLGGLDGADAHCKALATKAGVGDRDWKAYLSTQEDGKRGISARGRIGNGPW